MGSAASPSSPPGCFPSAASSAVADSSVDSVHGRRGGARARSERLGALQQLLQLGIAFFERRQRTPQPQNVDTAIRWFARALTAQRNATTLWYLTIALVSSSQNRLALDCLPGLAHLGRYVSLSKIDDVRAALARVVSGEAAPSTVFPLIREAMPS